MEREKSQPNVTLLIEVMPEETRIRTPTMNDISLDLEPGAEETLGLEFIDADQDLVEAAIKNEIHTMTHQEIKVQTDETYFDPLAEN